MRKIKLALFIPIILFVPFFQAYAFTIEKFEDKVENKFIVSPGRIEFDLEKGASASAEVLVVNRLGREVDFFVKKEAFGGRRNPLNAVAMDEWIVPEVKDFSLEHGERIKFKIDINIPRDAKSSGYYGSILIGTKGDDTQSKDRIEVVSQVGVPVFLAVKGEDMVKKASVVSFFAGKPFYFSGPSDFFVIVENKGNVHLLFRGEISIYNLLNAKIAQIPIKERVLLPGAKERQTASWDKKWLMGRYRADAVFYFDNGEKIQRSAVFYAFPAQIALLIVLAIYVVYRLIKYLRARYEIRLSAKRK